MPVILPIVIQNRSTIFQVMLLSMLKLDWKTFYLFLVELQLKLSYSVEWLSQPNFWRELKNCIPKCWQKNSIQARQLYFPHSFKSVKKPESISFFPFADRSRRAELCWSSLSTELSTVTLMLTSSSTNRHCPLEWNQFHSSAWNLWSRFPCRANINLFFETFFIPC